MLNPTQLAAREGCITASFLPKLMAGDEQAVINEWRRLTGDPRWQSDNFEDNWGVQFGSYIEPFALDWHERKTGRQLIRRGEVVHHPERPFFCCTLDAFRPDDRTVIDCKAPGQWRKLDDVLAGYVAQMVGQRACLKADRAALLVVHGGSEPVEYPIEWDEEYERELWCRVDALQLCVETLTPPFVPAPVAPPVKAVVTYDMQNSNAWAVLASEWLLNVAGKKAAEHAEKELKTLVPADAAVCFGAGVKITRARNGNLSLRSGEVR